MDIVKTFMNTLSFSNDNLLNKGMENAASVKKEDRFEAYLNKSYNKDTAVNKRDNKAVDTKDYKPKSVEKSNKKSFEKVGDSEYNSKTEKSEEGLNTKAASNADSEKLNQVKNDEIVNRIAEELGVSREQVQDILDELNISAMDLIQPENMLNFLQIIMKVDNAVDLLDIEGIKETLVNLKNIVEEISQKGYSDYDNLNMKEIEENINDILENSQMNSENVSSEVKTDETVENSAVVSEAIEETVVSKNENVLKNEEETLVQVSDSAGKAYTSVENSNQSNANSNQDQGFQMNNSVGMLDTSVAQGITKAFGEIISQAGRNQNINAADVINQIVQKLKTELVSENITELKMTLKPEYLGEVSLKLTTESGVVSAQFLAEDEKVKQVLEANMQGLEEALNERGIEVAQISVSVGLEQNNEAMRQFSFEQSKSSKRINDIIKTSFEETVDEVEEQNQYLDEEEQEILETNINYTA